MATKSRKNTKKNIPSNSFCESCEFLWLFFFIVAYPEWALFNRFGFGFIGLI